MSNYQQLLTRYIYTLRISNKMSQEKLGRIIGISKQGVYKIEKGNCSICLKHLVPLSDHFNIPLSQIFKEIEQYEDF